MKKISQNDVKKYLEGMVIPPKENESNRSAVQKLNKVAKYKDDFQKLTRWNCHAFILPLMLLPFESIPALTPTYAEIREDVNGPVPRICQWKTKFHRQQAPPLEQILHAVGDSTNIKSILVPTLEEQKANHMKGFVPYYDEPDAIVDNWATILESGTSIFWEDLLHADLEGRRNFLHGYESATATEQTRYLPSNPTVNESIPLQASSHADNSMVLREIQALKQTVEKMCTEYESRSNQRLGKVEIEVRAVEVRIVETPTCSSDKDYEEDILDVGQQKRRLQRHLKKSKYKRTPYTDPGPKKMMFRKGSMKEFDPLCLPDSIRKSFEDYKNSVLKPPFTSGLGITRAWNFFDQILTEHF
ncbi:hypothetical protein TIFTF001_039741 [Ficus carica]|uniref:Uncharacterized protein n=1 Tax=Ficus carica TaxID=3494 RepID=A0AA87YNN7_FICCA|nr:hypothetical protein TIFTF001_039741 [Ficus carica]